ncbi:adenosylcobinamide-phosphate synthase CbiB [Falsiroseomonas sp. E2-1-a20]|uniref:adenosylcobinamide-phosphate synthase CbiB n=1 Tax=Falsiroseomonas sp. E2-1-a20 TaxID=3239300 RepID=UPI003F2BB757
MIALALLALLLEAAFGYPQRLVDHIGHPVIWIGRLISAMDGAWNRAERGAAARRAAGVAALLVLVGVAGGGGALVQASLLAAPLGLLVLALLAGSLLAQRSLHDHVARVATALEQGGLEAGREAVSHIVGRDPLSLDEAGVARAAIESLAENFSDGVVAPAFWMAVAGLPGAAIYKAVNTADSMIGHRTPRHEAFGWASARCDDVLNLPASRLSGLAVVAAAALLPGMDARAAWRALRRDARRHRSPNAGWPEAAMAGALGLALAGPRHYAGVLVEDALMGDGRRDASAADIRAALRLYRAADALLIGVLVLIFLALQA